MDSADYAVAALARSFGLFHLLAMAAAPLAYALGPSNRSRFDKAARDIIDDEDTPL